MRIAHGHHNRRVSKYFLKGENVTAVLDEMAGEGVAEHMGRLAFR